MLAAKRHTLTFIHAANTHRHDALDDLDNDAIPLVPLTRVHSSTIQQPPPSALSKQHKRRGRMYRYVSHGIGGAGNFRKSLFLFFLVVVWGCRWRKRVLSDQIGELWGGGEWVGRWVFRNF